MTARVVELHRRCELRQASSLATARALRQASRLVDTPAEQRQLSSSARRMEACAVSARYILEQSPGEPTRLLIHNPRSCRQRICEQCEAVRAYKLSQSVAELLPFVWELCPTARAIFLTLTTRNRRFDDEGLAGMYRDHLAGLRRLFDRARVRDATLGHYSAFEVAVRHHKGEKFAGLHSHSMIIVDGERYFAGGVPLLHQTVWRNLWQSCARLDYRPIVDVRAVRSPDGSTGLKAAQIAARELLKYVVKPHTFFAHENGSIKVDPMVALTVSRVLRRQRITRFDRIFVEAKKRQKQQAKQAKTVNSESSGADL